MVDRAAFFFSFLTMFSVFLGVLSFSFSSITAVLSNKCGFQLQYQMIFCVWLLAFSPQLCEQLRRYNVVPALSDILQESVKEKVTRIILAAFRVCAEFLKYCFSVMTWKFKSADSSNSSFFLFSHKWFWMVVCVLLNLLHNCLHLHFHSSKK